MLNSYLHLSLRFHYEIIFISMPLKDIYIVMIHTFVCPAQILPLNLSHMYTVDYLIPPFATHLPSPAPGKYINAYPEVQLSCSPAGGGAKMAPAVSVR